MRVLIADKQTITRSALAALLQTSAVITVAGETASAEEIVPLALKLRAQVTVIDGDSLGRQGFEAATRLSVDVPACRSLILSSAATLGHLHQVATMRASGFLLKDVSAARLIQAIREIAGGYHVVDCRFTMAQRGTPRHLTARELDVLRLVADGADVHEIARQLSLATGTVRNNLSRIVNKFNARTRVDAVRVGRELGVI
ncbi:response regulator transcription factor [Streptosporangium sp. NPDC002524]|uniref:response regulator transcription factor n=1 Tax=Streptosporangium sp. NPDC002524 TaxID=3154537 RepID=UPI0033257A35